MLTVGLTGNYGMGKSTVLDMFRELGAVTIRADGIVDLLLQEASVLSKIRGLLGDSVFSAGGSLEKKKVASIIFRDKVKRDALEEILHPLVFERIREITDRLGRNDSQNNIMVIEIPLLFEGGYEGQVQKTITVYTEEETALERLSGAGISREDAMMRLDVQMPVREKIKRADFAINNSGTLEETEAQVGAIYELFKRMIARSPGK